MKRIGLLIVVCAVLMSFKLDDPANYFTFDKTTHDFGEISQGVPVETQFVMSNTGDQPILINTVTTQCGCTTPVFKTIPITKGMNDTILVGYNAAALGSFTKKLTVKTNFGNSELYIRGTVVKK